MEDLGGGCGWHLLTTLHLINRVYNTWETCGGGGEVVRKGSIAGIALEE